MAESVVQIVWICTGVFSHGSIMWWEKDVKIFHTAGLNLTLYSAGSHWESGHVPLQVFPLGFSSHSPVPGHSFSSFLWPEIQDVSWSFSHLLYCCSCSTLKISQRGQSHKRKEGQKRNSESLTPVQSLLQVLTPFYHPPTFVYISVFKLFCILPRIFSQWEKWGICGWSFCVMPITKHPKRFISFI